MEIGSFSEAFRRKNKLPFEEQSAKKPYSEEEESFEPLTPVKTRRVDRKSLTIGILIFLILSAVSLGYFYYTTQVRKVTEVDDISVELVDPNVTPGVSTPVPTEVSPLTELRESMQPVHDSFDLFDLQVDSEKFQQDLDLIEPII